MLFRSVSEPVLVHAAAAVVDAAPLAVLPAARIAVPDEDRPASSVERLRAAPLAVLPVERIAPPDEERPIVSSVDRLRGRR